MPLNMYTWEVYENKQVDPVTGKAPVIGKVYTMRPNIEEARNLARSEFPSGDYIHIADVNYQDLLSLDVTYHGFI